MSITDSDISKPSAAASDRGTGASEHRITVAFNVLRLLDRPTSTSGEVAEAIEADAHLTEQILKMARSPLCGVRADDLTVNRALVLLGFLTIRKLVVVSLCREMGNAAGGDAERWAHALWVGISAEEITRRLDEAAASEALMVGMMRQISDSLDGDKADALEFKGALEPARLDRFLAAAEQVAGVIVDAQPGLPSTAEIDEALERGGVPGMRDGKLGVDIRRGYELYASLLG